MLRSPRLFWNVSPHSLSIKADGHVAERAKSNGSSSGSFSPHSGVDSLLSV